MAPTKTAESELRMALRHVQEGRACVMRQRALVTRLADRGLKTENAEGLLHWFEENQRRFESDYQALLWASKQKVAGGLAAIEGDWRRDDTAN